MTIYLRVANKKVVESFALPKGFDLKDCFTPDVAATFVEKLGGADVGWAYDGTTFTPPALGFKAQRPAEKEED